MKGWAFMFDAFVKIDGIDGECSDQQHSGWIEAIHYDFSVAQKVSRTASSAGGATAERSDFSEFTFSKFLDVASPKMALSCAEGRHFDTIKIEFCRAGKVTYMRYKLTDCLISKVSTHGYGDFPEEEVAINFGRIEFTYTQQSRNRGIALGVVAAGWDRVKNCKI
jgi:type VI secretion system secreted protein Hcp